MTTITMGMTAKAPASTRGIRLWAHKWIHWEYWPMKIANIPVVGMYLWFALRARRLFFFTAVNPALPFGGAFGVSKFDILQRLPKEIVPAGILVMPSDTESDVFNRLLEMGIGFPLIAKPDIGERGFQVQKIETATELSGLLKSRTIPYILQEWLDLPCEMGVLFHRLGDQFSITSVCRKIFLEVSGDGERTVAELMAEKPRAAMQIERLSILKPELMARVPAAGEKVLLEPIGNHNRGTIFEDARELLDEEMRRNFERICSAIEGVYYGRFDLRCANETALRAGEIKVMELNGVFGEPAHVYSPGYGGLRAYRDLFQHWKIIFNVSRANMARGARAAGLNELRHIWKRWKTHGSGA